MVVCFGGGVLTGSASFSVGPFIKHLSSSRLRRLSSLNLSMIKRSNPITNFASRLLTTSHFETLTSNQKEQIHLYVEALLQWNQKMNLTAVKETCEVMERHIEDSLAIISPIRSSYIQHCGASSSDRLNVIDVGSGPGLPGLVLAIACPSWSVTLLESMNKRCVFLEHAIGLTGLSNVKAVRGRAEDRIWDKIFPSESCMMLQLPGQLRK